ncbi:UDP-N-acetylglucosamine diphosphorylase/glucosamine-1-phosphate N-acetyltransferase [Thermanaerovibrio velox DSM 12556]|uniref:Bifunctional protein GlmU n=1 Tax=Thermanaerovibrio velox DSM 12556 TaxID=926567 RepID=H0URB8_9BACT|nr:bifunctional UDP-N-acetylglucosamine diphosphorylase/glucosamine-1-phosphate N-acetyltransferase GlmU [Thermanaerovibrio velox]EHM09874.1 UDP-N-acetylglucosamine diphosphorylase/glucosamine-1-phosphate N-acetyltransferase [Thermanaerovibrio velox DSM 12556]
MSAGLVGGLVLAAGKGTRLKSSTPKALFPILGEPLVYYPLRAMEESGVSAMCVVVGHEGEAVASCVRDLGFEASVAFQSPMLGTAHAVMCARDWWKELKHLLVLPVDAPMLSGETLRGLIDSHLSQGNLCTLLAFEAGDPSGYGRVIRSGGAVRIVEEKDASPEEKAVRLCNGGVYVFDVEALDGVLERLDNRNAQGEYYLPDAVSLLSQMGSIGVLSVCEDELRGINDPLQYAQLSELLRLRVLTRWLSLGLKCLDLNSVWIGPRVEIGHDVWIEQGVTVIGRSRIGDSCRIGAMSWLNHVEMGSRCRVLGNVRMESSKLGDGVQVGPFAFLRDGVIMEDGSLAGRFVEIKKSRIGEGSKVPHLSYVGDASIGRDTNIGAGAITCNYDGVSKNPTIIGDNCFIGSDTMLVAPVSVGDGATTAAGSVITQDVPAGSLGVARARQRNVEGWSRRRHKKD